MKYRKKPVVIEAVKFLGFNDSDEAVFDCDSGDYTESWLWGNWQNGKIKCLGELGKLLIQTLEGSLQASVGDYIIQGVNGEIYPCKPDIFEKTYEKA